MEGSECARVVVLGLCMERDRLEPDIAEGKIPVERLITGKVGLDGVPGAFAALDSPQQHVKVVVEPSR